MEHAFIKTQHPWLSPVAAAAQLTKDESCFVFLHSGRQENNTGRYSYLAMHPLQTVSGESFSAFNTFSSDKSAFENAWFGYLGYELLHDVEKINHEQKSYITLPGLWLSRFGLIIEFDHQNNIATSYRAENIAPPLWPSSTRHDLKENKVASLSSPMKRDEYLRIVEKTITAIHKGDFYQANITRKFTGEFTSPPDLFSIFSKLSEASPAVYSAFIRMGNSAIISSSPECFLKIDNNGYMESRPIKGTAPRFADKGADEQSRKNLAASEKDRAENMMIVDLMRNDFAHSCEAGSVKVENLFDVASYTTLHHMISTIIGQKRKDVPTPEAVKYCFPPGSMTGAPKFKAMQWCMEHEKIRRGVYSGALGWFGGDGSCDLSVVIRTLVMDGTRFEFQVGGGIVADSEPEKEWQETIVKARGIMAALGLDAAALEKI